MELKRKNFWMLFAILVACGLTLLSLSSCGDDDSSTSKPDNTLNSGNSDEGEIVGSWSLYGESDTTKLRATFMNNGTFWYKSRYSSYRGTYKQTKDSVIFTFIHSKYYTHKSSVKIIELTDLRFVFEGYDLQRNNTNLVFSGIFRGTKQKRLNNSIVTEYKKNIVGNWNIYQESAPLSIGSDGTFMIEKYYGTYDICDDKILFFEETGKCSLNGLYTIKVMDDAKMILVDEEYGWEMICFK